MTQAPETDTMELQIVACEGCDQLFLVSPRRGTCPTCGGSPGVEFFTFDAGPQGVQLRGGLAVEAAAPAPSEPPGPNGIPAPEVADAPQAAPDEAVMLSVVDALALNIAALLVDEEDSRALEIREQLLELGADPEAATTAVGRLEAVRNLLADLTRPPAPETGIQTPAGEPDDVPETQDEKAQADA